MDILSLCKKLRCCFFLSQIHEILFFIKFSFSSCETFYGIFFIWWMGGMYEIIGGTFSVYNNITCIIIYCVNSKLHTSLIIISIAHKAQTVVSRNIWSAAGNSALPPVAVFSVSVDATSSIKFFADALSSLSSLINFIYRIFCSELQMLHCSMSFSKTCRSMFSFHTWSWITESVNEKEKNRAHD